MGMSPSAVAEGQEKMKKIFKDCMVLVFFASKCNMSFGSTCHEQIHWAHKRCHGFDQLFLAETLDVVQDIDWVISLGNAFAKQYELYTYDDEHSALLHRLILVLD
ncbi:hypothetical protein Lser_V15G27245 [Lactuca serriola]